MRFVRNPTDLAAGLMFIACAGLAYWLVQDLRIGTAMRMGPGYMPRLVVYCLAALGAAIVVGALVRDGPRLERWDVRGLVLVSAAIAVFAVSIRFLGLVPSIALVAVVAALASAESRTAETALLAGGLAGFCVLIFVYVLGLPLAVWPPFLVN